MPIRLLQASLPGLCCAVFSTLHLRFVEIQEVRKKRSCAISERSNFLSLEGLRTPFAFVSLGRKMFYEFYVVTFISSYIAFIQ